MIELNGLPLRIPRLAVLRERLLVAARALGLDAQDAGDSVADLVQLLSRRVKDSGDPRECWLLFIAVAGCFPTQDEVDDLLRRLDLAMPGGAMLATLGATIEAASSRGRPLAPIELAVSTVVVDVDFCATQEHNTGIQRVVRETMPLWVAAGYEIQLVAWTSDGSSMRALMEAEADRVLNWKNRRYPEEQDVSDTEPILVPWKSRVFLPEVPRDSLCQPLMALALSSGNSVALVGYDAIPLVSAETQPLAESQRFADYLSIVKHADVVLGISESAANEFRGFVEALPAQGLVGPQVRTVSLPVGRSSGQKTTSTLPSSPVIACVGSHEPRKNQEAVLHAAERLFRQGYDFEIIFVGGGSRANIRDFDREVSRLRRSGFRVRSVRRMTDLELWQLYRVARFTIFVSRHEGFGLPVAESLALGTPVLTSSYGSLEEISRGGGCVTVDPRSDSEIFDGIRKMLTDDELIERLRRATRMRKHRSWEDYAAELWVASGLKGTAA